KRRYGRVETCSRAIGRLSHCARAGIAAARTADRRGDGLDAARRQRLPDGACVQGDGGSRRLGPRADHSAGRRDHAAAARAAGGGGALGALNSAMAEKATIFKADLTVADMDRNHFATHALTLARHPSETDERMMVRLLAFALHADERLQFGKGISSDDEPDLWRKDLTGEILEWIELGQPDESRIRKACGRARQVIVINYGGRAADIWWEKNAATLERAKNLTVIDIPAAAVSALAALAERTMRLQCMIQDHQVQV